MADRWRAVRPKRWPVYGVQPATFGNAGTPVRSCPAERVRAVDVRLAQHPGSDTTVVSLHGQLDIDTSSVLGDVLTQLHRQAVHRIVVDLADVSFCDSTGLSALLVAFHPARATGGYLRLAGPSPFLLRLLTVTGVHGTVP